MTTIPTKPPHPPHLLTLLLLLPRSRPALPPPSAGRRPSPPSRRLVRAILPSLIRRSCAEAREWTASRRNAGAKLLATVCAFAGAAASDHLDEIFAACHSAVQDEDADTAARVLGAARCVGAHCPGEQWLPFSLDAICAEERGKGKHTSDANRAAALCVLAAALRGVKPGTLGARSAEVLFAGVRFGEGEGGFGGGLRAPRVSRVGRLLGGGLRGRRHRRRRPARGRPRRSGRSRAIRAGKGRSG